MVQVTITLEVPDDATEVVKAVSALLQHIINQARLPWKVKRVV